jgi:phosphopantothenoylcysteine decarboxylase/phosphopantothenate--cysteine ligase
MHPAEEIRGSKSTLLLNKRIVLGVTGSIAAVETIKLSRELICQGADVIPVMSPAAARIIHPDSLWFATGHQPICELTGETEHVQFCGKVKQPVDLYLISPCTANTISKIAYGIDDTAVTTFATTAIGSKIHVVIVPAMHQSMYDHSVIQQNIASLKLNGVVFIGPSIEANKAKMASIERISHQVIRLLGPQDFNSKKVLIIGGSTAEPIDAVRNLCNTSSGKTAIALSQSAYHHGAMVELWYGQSSQPIPSYIEDVTSFTSISDVEALVRSKDFSEIDIIFVCAALSDYIPTRTNGKIPSDGHQLNILCHPAPKILSLLHEKARHTAIIGFKLEQEKDILLSKAKKLQETYDLEMVIANTVDNLRTEYGEVVLIRYDGAIRQVKGSKTEIAEEVFSFFIEKMRHD